MKVEFLKLFEKDLESLLQPKLQNNIFEVIAVVEKASKMSEIKNLKKLKGFKNAYRIKIADYRIGIFIEHGIVEFARIVHRKDIYRQ